MDLYSIREHLINVRKEVNPEKIKMKIKNYDVVSFDIFDTLVKRRIPREKDLFKLVALNYNLTAINKMDVTKFYEARKIAAIQAINNLTDESEDIQLFEIYNQLPPEYDYCKNDLMLEELKLEIKLCQANLMIKDIYDWCIKQGKTVIIISDMYLSYECITTILHNCGYAGYDEIFLSSKVKKKKATGRLYEHVLKQEKYSDKKIIHIGDSLRSDYLEAKKHGFEAIKIPKYPIHIKFYNRGRKVSKQHDTQIDLGRIINNTINVAKSDYYKYGYEALGVLLLGYSQWLNNIIKEKGIEKVFFLARDGYLIQSVYNCLYEEENRVDSSYLYVSRKSIQFPLLWAYDNLGDYFSLNGNKRWYIEMICARLDIDYTEGLKYWEEIGLSKHTSFKTFELYNNPQIALFYEKFREEAVERSKQAFESTKRYLDQCDFYGRVAIVDSGSINFTTQNCLIKFCELANIDVLISGLYLWTGEYSDGDIENYIYKDNKIIGGESILIEFPLTSPEGTTNGYKIEKNVVRVLVDSYEYSDGMMNEVINDIQKGVADFICAVKEWSKFNSISSEIAHAAIKAISRTPNVRESKMFGNLMFKSDNQETYLAKPKKILHYLFDVHGLKRDFLKTRWGIGFFKRLFKVPLPYWKIVYILRYMYNRRR